MLADDEKWKMMSTFLGNDLPSFFFFTDPPPPKISPLPQHDALPLPEEKPDSREKACAEPAMPALLPAAAAPAVSSDTAFTAAQSLTTLLTTESLLFAAFNAGV